MGKLFENTGLLQGARKSIFGPTTQEFLSGKAGLKFKEFIWNNSTSDIMSASKNNIDDFDFYNTLDKLKAKHKGKSFEEVDDILTKELIEDQFLIKATANNLPTVRTKGNRMTRMLDEWSEKTYGTRLVTENKSDSLVKLNRFIRLSTSSLDDATKITKRNDFMKKAMKALDSKNAPGEVALLVSRYLEKSMKPMPKMKTFTPNTILGPSRSFKYPPGIARMPHASQPAAPIDDRTVLDQPNSFSSSVISTP